MTLPAGWAPIKAQLEASFESVKRRWFWIGFVTGLVLRIVVEAVWR